ncbi:MAG: hypothetical protein H0T70_00275 [Acidimicrobiia bacterium]|nr:hypothetical protein [Acidimicrobiia bacterium]
MSRRWMAPLLALVIAATLAADVGLVVARAGDDDTAEPEFTQELPEDFKPVLAELQAFVEQSRGLKFKKPPNVALIPDAEFEEVLQGGEEPEAADIEDQEEFLGVMEALGLFDGDVDLDSAAQGQIASIVGFYNYETEGLYVRSVQLDPYAKSVLVHELTHALDDQHFGLYRPDLEDADAGDASSAFQALVEGSAMAVQIDWHKSRSPEERDAIESADQAAVDGLGESEAEGPESEVFAKIGSFPYFVGPRFVEALRDEGGQAALDAAFEDPPTTTEQVLHPQHFIDNRGALRVSAPPANGKVVDEGSLGELGIYLVTGTAVGEGRSVDASEGWGGDSFKAWSEDDRICIRWDLRMDTPDDTTELVDVLEVWAADHPGAKVTGRDPVQVTNCA